MVQRKEFRTLSVSEALVLLDANFELQRHLSLVENGQRQGPFIRSDFQWAKRLCMSPETFRRARYKIGRTTRETSKTVGLGWITYTPGYRRQDGSVEATEYQDAKYAKVQKGKQSGALSCDTWHRLIELLKKGKVKHESLVAVALLCYFWKIQGGREVGSVVIPKAAVKATGMSPQVYRRALSAVVQVLPDLFTLKNKHRAFEIAHWKGGPDASKEISDRENAGLRRRSRPAKDKLEENAIFGQKQCVTGAANTR